MLRKLAGIIVLCLMGTLATAGLAPRYRVLSPITHGSLTVFPVVADATHDTSAFLTLDEGLRSGEVVVTEAGRAPGLIRRQRPIPLPQRGGAEVNRLVLINNSGRPLLLLAGEIVTGGKQDRVIGKDRIVPAHSDPVDLSVFCVEPGRWTETSAQFKGLGAQMAQPSVRQKAMARKDQQEVWNSVAQSKVEVMAAAPAAAGAVGGTSSYATVMDNKAVQEQVDKVAAPIEREYRSLIGELRQRNAVGVVVAVRGRLIWADLFASPALLERYWPKLVRSYAAEALVPVGGGKIDVGAAQNFLLDMNGRREVSETEPGIFRHSEITGDGYKVFELTSLLPKTGFEIHIAKMAE